MNMNIYVADIEGLDKIFNLYLTKLKEEEISEHVLKHLEVQHRYLKGCVSKQAFFKNSTCYAKGNLYLIDEHIRKIHNNNIKLCKREVCFPDMDLNLYREYVYKVLKKTLDFVGIKDENSLENLSKN